MSPSLLGHDQVLQACWRQDMGYPVLIMTPSGGLALALTADVALLQGEVVEISTAGTKLVEKATNARAMPIGAAYQATSSGGTVYIVVDGIGYVKPADAITASPGRVCYVASSCDGRVNQSSALPVAALDHNAEVGHFLETGSSAGAAALAVLHFN